MSNSYGSSDSSIGGESSTGSGEGDSNADENITHTRGVIDDALRNLQSVRSMINAENWESVAGKLDDADEIIEEVRALLTAAQMESQPGYHGKATDQ